MIYSCNSVLKTIDPETTNETLQYFMAQALGYRAWAYFNLAQMYQFTYVGSQDKPCVPIITEENSDIVAVEGAPRATVQDVYDRILNDFVKTYRNPQYNCTLSSATDIQDEIWHQRRIELWGEGLAYYDIQRLKKPMDRVGGGFEPSVVFNIPADSPLRLYLIPLTETQTNPQLPSSANNPEGPVPTPIAE